MPPPVVASPPIPPVVAPPPIPPVVAPPPIPPVVASPPMPPSVEPPPGPPPLPATSTTAAPAPARSIAKERDKGPRRMQLGGSRHVNPNRHSRDQRKDRNELVHMTSYGCLSHKQG